MAHRTFLVCLALLVLQLASPFSAFPATEEEMDIDSLLQQLDSTQTAKDSPFGGYVEHLPPSTNELMKENKKISETDDATMKMEATEFDESPFSEYAEHLPSKEDLMNENKELSEKSDELTMTDEDAEMFDANVAPFESVGCYYDKSRPRPIPILIKNLRPSIDWYHMNKTVLACARLVQAKGYRYFGIQFYGECWSGPNVHQTFQKDGASTHCWSGVGKGGSYYVYRFGLATTTKAPTTVPTTQAPTTKAPTTQAPTTKAPTTKAPTTKAPTTQAPTTEAPTTQAPTTKAPTTQAPTTKAPTTQASTTVSPVIPECSSYGVLSSADRAAAFAGSSYVCDNNLSPGWYRFSGAAGTRMPTRCVPKHHCGTHAPGWMNGTLPSVAEGAVSRPVCFHWRTNCCFWRKDIQVRNCGGFYVYKLVKPPVCRLRYCGNKGMAPVTPTPRPTSQGLECSSYRVLDSADRAMAFSGSNYVCDNKLASGWYRFSGAAGARMPTKCVPKHHCGTHAPGWMNGTLPSPAEGVVSRHACFHWGSSCCRWRSNMQVRNCGGFFVYRLQKTPVCRLRYCGNNGAPVTSTPKPTTQVPTTVAPTTLAPTTSRPGPECSAYRLLNSADRAMSHAGSSYSCDNQLSPGWYRFSGAAGTRMPTACVPKYRCGTHAPGWMNGTLPNVADGAVSRRVCFSWRTSCCLWNTNIQVRNCGGFFVYRLPKTPKCRLRYCGNGLRVPTTVAPTTIPTTPRPALNVYRLCESRNGVLRCPAGRRLKVLYSNYGRTSGRQICPHPAMRTTNCRSAESARLIRCACNGRNACPLYAKNEVYGDPCVGTYKYIEVRYLCV